MTYEVIDFHTHPFTDDTNNICSYIPYCNMSVESTRELFRQIGISRICGSVIINGKDRPKDLSNIDHGRSSLTDDHQRRAHENHHRAHQLPQPCVPEQSIFAILMQRPDAVLFRGKCFSLLARTSSSASH